MRRGHVPSGWDVASQEINLNPKRHHRSKGGCGGSQQRCEFRQRRELRGGGGVSAAVVVVHVPRRPPLGDVKRPVRGERGQHTHGPLSRDSGRGWFAGRPPLPAPSPDSHSEWNRERTLWDQLTEDTGHMEAPSIRVVRDVFTSTWRVTCDLHGRVSQPKNFWTASRDKRDHAQVCELVMGNEETDPSE